MKEIASDYLEILNLMQGLTKKVFHKVEAELSENGNSKLYFALCEIEMNLLCSIRHLNNIAGISNANLGQNSDSSK